MTPRLIKPEPLTAAAFAPYGDVIECVESKQTSINYGHTDCFHDLARLELTAEGGRPIVRIFRSTPVPRPVHVKIMERHQLSSQAFYPLSNRPYLVVVAERGSFDPKKVRVFLAGAKQGVNYHAGTWHHFSLALEDVSEFMVLDRDGPGDNCDEVSLEGENAIIIDY
jgi:ureidoglycolate lyase